jgi:anti-sigma-K factor RskA
MTPTQEGQERIKNYLLGLLSDEARQEIEQDILSNQEVLAEILMVEDDLTDEYVRGGLSPHQRTQFENHFLAPPARQENLRFARALNRYVTTHPSGQTFTDRTTGTWFFRNQARLIPVAAAVAVIVIAAAAALWFFIPRQTAPQTFATLTLSLTPNTRGEEAQLPRVKLPLGKDALKIFLKLPQSVTATRYRVQLVNTGGESKSLTISEQDAQSIAVEIPATQLRPGQYALNLIAVKADGTEQRLSGSYYFIAE